MSKKLITVVRQQAIGLLALFVALGGTSYAVATGSINSREIKNGSIRSKDIRDGQVSTRDVKNASLLSADFKPGQLPAGPKGPKGDTPAPGPWHEIGAPGEPAFRGGAANTRQLFVCSGPEPQPASCPTYETAGFYKDPFGQVHLKGSIVLGDDTIPFALPAGYRPGKAVVLPITNSRDVPTALIVYDQFVRNHPAERILRNGALLARRRVVPSRALGTSLLGLLARRLGALAAGAQGDEVRGVVCAAFSPRDEVVGLQEWMGHRDIQTTQRYADYCPNPGSAPSSRPHSPRVPIQVTART